MGEAYIYIKLACLKYLITGHKRTMASLLSAAVRRHLSTSAVKQAVGAGVGVGAGGHKDAAKSMKMWKNISIFVCPPAIILTGINAYIGHIEEMKKPRPKFIPYEHLRIRNKPFPWGDGNKTLFHNPRVNALPDGYEDEIEGDDDDDE